MREQAEGRTFEEAALNYLDKNKSKFGLKGAIDNHLKHRFTYNGGDIIVVRFQQMYKGLPVDENQMIITLNRAKEIIFLLNYTRPVNEDIKIQSYVNKKMALFRAISTFGPVQIPPKVRNEKIIHFIDNKPVLCYRVRFSLDIPNGDWITFVDAHNNTVVRQFNNLHFFQASSGTGTGNIFNPDPISTSGAIYGSGGFVHGNDTSNSDLTGQLITVTFPLGTQFSSGPAYLQGPKAYNNLDPDPCYSPTATWLLDRSDDCFESVMCYFHIDKSMEQYYSLGGLQPYQNAPDDKAVRYVAYSEVLNFPGAYNSDLGYLRFAKFENAQGQTIDVAEDAAAIIHELGHGINDWMAPGGISEVEGLGEGFADYWAQSYSRNLGSWNENEPQYHRVCNWFMFNDVLPADQNRTTDFEIDEYPSDLTDLEKHIQGQLFSTAMMRIYDDIGKDKTDYIAIKGIAQTGSVTEQWEAAEAIFGAAVTAKSDSVNIKNAGIFINSNDLCIIYEHFKDIYGDAFNPTPPEGQGDYYIRDIPTDFGVEPDPNPGPMWRSEDIWIRSGDDDGETIQVHENPEYGQNNYIYVRLRSRGCVPLTQGTLRLYFSKASTLLTWPFFWEDYYVLTPGGTVLAGDEVDSSPMLIPNDLRAGEERIVKFAWNNMPDPGDFPFDRHHFCLLARIESTQDPMASVEVADVGTNARNNNNIAWKNVSILGGIPDPTWGTLFEGTVFVHQPDSTSLAANNIRITSPALPGYVPCQGQGDLYVRLQDGLHTIWQNNGSEGEGFALQTDGRLKITDASATIEDLTMATGTPYYLTVEYSPDTGALPCICDLEQKNAQDQRVGGERFIFDPEAGQSLRDEGGDDRIQASIKSTSDLFVYPVPASDVLQVGFQIDSDDTEVWLSVYDSQGKFYIQKEAAILPRQRIEFALEVSQLPAGLYYLRITAADNGPISYTRFIKL
ncbi:MAG: T9SS C-terminal target domain-containing protein [Haliscomenobacteraceae bacterium CHB4]|nr:hypothetical protein [Saprospiraceae bacterium]MCE7921809.1 T9SS C-terminal target domain-containing protein [Haliscomenobacteraceae bacterium CHB4]